MGYCEKEEIMKLYNIYKQDFKEAYFKFTLGSVDYNENITVDEIADMLGTINYEIISRVSDRVPRVFK